MSLLISKNQSEKRLNYLDAKIEKIQKQITPLQTHNLFPDFEVQLKNHLVNFYKDILIRKDKKFQRDKRAFQEGKAYKWQLNQTGKHNPSNTTKVIRHKDVSNSLYIHLCLLFPQLLSPLHSTGVVDDWNVIVTVMGHTITPSIQRDPLYGQVIVTRVTLGIIHIVTHQTHKHLLLTMHHHLMHHTLHCLPHVHTNHL